MVWVWGCTHLFSVYIDDEVMLQTLMTSSAKPVKESTLPEDVWTFGSSYLPICAFAVSVKRVAEA